MDSELSVSITEKAAEKLRELLQEEGKDNKALRVFVQGGGCSGFQYGLMIEENEPGPGDNVFESNGVRVFVDPISLTYLKGASVEYIETDTQSGFKIVNPNATSTCGCGSSFNTE